MLVSITGLRLFASNGDNGSLDEVIHLYMKRSLLVIHEKDIFIHTMTFMYGNTLHLLWINDLLIIICIILLYRVVLCSVLNAILLLFWKRDSNNEAFYPVSSAKLIYRNAAMIIPDKIYCLIRIKGEQVRMVTKPRTLGLFGHCNNYQNHHCTLLWYVIIVIMFSYILILWYA